MLANIAALVKDPDKEDAFFFNSVDQEMSCNIQNPAMSWQIVSEMADSRVIFQKHHLVKQLVYRRIDLALSILCIGILRDIFQISLRREGDLKFKRLGGAWEVLYGLLSLAF